MNKAPQISSESIVDETGHTLFVVTYTSTKGEVMKKTLTPDEYIKLLGGSLKEDRTYWHIRQDFLPEGFVDGAISDEENYIMAFEVPRQVRYFAHTSGNYNVPYPKLLFLLEMKRGHVLSRYVFALKDNDTTLYHYPFGNVSSEGSICTGNIELDDVRKEGPVAFSELFYLGKTNNDYVSSGCFVKGKLKQETLLKKLDGKRKFPERLLTPMMAGIRNLSDVKRFIEKKAS